MAITDTDDRPLPEPDKNLMPDCQQGQHVDAETIRKVLRATYGHSQEYAMFEELRHGTGYGAGYEGAIDAWVFNLYPTHHLARTAFEIKISHSDYVKEMHKPLKRRYPMLVSNYFYFIAPQGILSPDEIPLECGLMELVPRKLFGRSEYKLSVTVPAPYRDTGKPTWRFMASICRRIHRLEEKIKTEGRKADEAMVSEEE